MWACGIWDLRTNRSYYSPEWKRQLGYDEDEIGDDHAEWEQRVHPDDLPRAQANTQAYLAAPWPNFEQEFRMRHKDGSYRWILTQAALVYDETGSATHMFGSHIDITETKRAELALAEAERFARATLDGLSAHIAIVAADGTIVAVNRAWRQFAAANLPADVPAGSSAPQRCARAPTMPPYAGRPQPPAARRHSSGWTACAGGAGGRNRAGGVRVCLPQPRRTALVCRPHLAHARAGPPWLVVAHENITQRKRGEMALRESEARYRSHVRGQSHRHGAGERASGAIVDANPAAAAYYGWSREQMRSMSAFDIHVPPRQKCGRRSRGQMPKDATSTASSSGVRTAPCATSKRYSSPVQLDGRQLYYVDYARCDRAQRRRSKPCCAARRRSSARRQWRMSAIGPGICAATPSCWSDEAKRIFGLDPTAHYADLNQVIDAGHPSG